MSDLTHNTFWLVPVSVLIGGFIGSPHCMSMCGPIVINFAREKTSLLAYQFGRMIAYSAAGAWVGAFGQVVLGRERPVWISGASLALIAVVLIFNAYRAITQKSSHLPSPKFLNALISKALTALRLSSLPKQLIAFGAGFLTVFLPCGHLYGFLIGAVATGSAMGGAAFMFAFWLGSTPLLSFGGFWIQKLIRPKANQRWAGFFLGLAGILSLIAFGAKAQTYSKQILDVSPSKVVSTKHSCH